MMIDRRSLLFGLTLSIAMSALTLSPGQAQESLQLEAGDGLQITADVYPAADEDAPWIVTAHQAGSSRGEYREIAPRLQALGYHVLSLDQRAGGQFADVTNETAERAAKAGLSTSFTDALPDIVAGLTYANAQTDAPVLLWGSSYSAALALVLAGEQPDLLDGALAFSPGEYLSGKSVANAASGIAMPVFITSAASETGQWSPIYEAIAGSDKVAFRPEQGGVHGSSSLISGRNAGAEAYWQAVEGFLSHYAHAK